MFVAFREHVDAIANDESVGCVVVTGAQRGEVFAQVMI